MPRVSIVIPAYNAERFLDQTLASVTRSTYRDWEVVVIDDGSSDGTADVARRHGPQVRLIQQPNSGMSASRNRGIAESDSEYVALLDADDLWHPRKLALQAGLLDARPEVGVCYSEFFSWDGAAEPAFLPEVDATLDERLSGWIYHRMLLTNFVLPSSAMFRRSAMAHLGPFLCQNQQTDDWEYTVRASRLWPFAKLAAPLVAYRQSPGSLSKRPSPNNATELMRESLIQRFGLAGPQGQAVDAAELAWRRYKGWRDFADMHVARGDLATGLRCFGRLMLNGPWRGQTALTLARASAKRVAPRAGRA